MARGRWPRWGARTADVHVTVVDDRDIRRLNARYLGSRKRTDVLAFDLRRPRARRRCSGEVMVSADTAARQARRGAACRSRSSWICS